MKRINCVFLLSLFILLAVVSGNAAAKNPAAPLPRGTSQPAVANITVNYLGSWDPAAQAAVSHAMQIWSQLIYSPVDIAVDATWGDVWMGTPAAVYSTYVASNQLPDPVAYYPEPLANALSASDSSSDADFIMQFNSSIANWYFGLDGQGAANAYDLVTVALKYGGIGLGFASTMSLCGPQASWGCWGFDNEPDYPMIYDKFIVNGADQLLVDETLFPDQSEALGDQLTSNNVFFNGPRAFAANGGAPPKLYAPSTWSDVRHAMLLDDGAFAPGTINALMTHTLSPGEVIHHPGSVAVAMLRDLGWRDIPQGPQLAQLPAQMLLRNTTRDNAIDLWQFAADPDTPIHQLSFTFTDVTDYGIGLTFDGTRFVDLRPRADWTGYSQVTVQVEDDAGNIDSASFDVYVVEQVYTTLLPVLLR